MRTSCIAVLTPYSAQKNLIEEKMKKAELDIKVASIIESQGELHVHVHECRNSASLHGPKRTF